VTIVTARTVTNVGPRFEWYPLAVRDEAFFHVLISSTASHAAYLQYKRNELPRHFYHHRGEAIRLLNQRIEKGMHDEGTINTVAMFCQQEVTLSWNHNGNSLMLEQSFEGRARTAKEHIDGLRHIVQDAGGPHSSELSAKTRRHIYL
jgi:Fungal specific transcription factor domain